MSWFRLKLSWVFLSMLLSACGGSSNSNSRVQMGGAIQGTSLVLSRTVSTFAGNATNGSTNGAGASAGFWNPAGITTDGTNLYVADSGNNTIRKVAIAFGNVTTLAGSAGNAGSTNGAGSAASFNNPQGITTDGANLYVADSGNNTIRKVVIATGVVTTLAGSAGNPGSTDGTGGAANFSNPQGITTDGANLYVTDSSNNTIRTIAIATGVVTTLAGSAGTQGSTDSSTGITPSFWNPQGITTDGAKLYVTDSNNNTIRRVVIATGAVTTLAGTSGNPVPILLNGSWQFSNYSSPTPVNGTGAFSRFIGPNGITTDGRNLYVTDAASTIRKIVISTGVVTTLAGKAGFFALADGPGADARFWFPQGITTDGRSLFVADRLNNTIRKVF
jgi:sugar lactone lactonase YvrE